MQWHLVALSAVEAAGFNTDGEESSQIHSDLWN